MAKHGDWLRLSCGAGVKTAEKVRGCHLIESKETERKVEPRRVAFAEKMEVVVRQKTYQIYQC